TVASQPPTGSGWAHELNHDGYRRQIHIRDGRIRLYTRRDADWSKRYPRIVAVKGSAIIDAEAVYLDAKGRAQFDLLHSRFNDHVAIATAFDLLMCANCFARMKTFNMSLTSRVMAPSVSSSLQAWPGRNCFKETECTVSLRSIEAWIKVKNPK